VHACVCVGVSVSVFPLGSGCEGFVLFLSADFP